MRTTIFALITIALINPTSYAKTSVWKASNGDNHIYLGGTVHVLSASDYPLPCEFDAAYNDSEKVVLETDFAVLSSPEFAQQAAFKGIYLDGTTLADRIQPGTRQRLDKYLTSLGIPPQSVMPLRPGMLMSVITIAELRKIGVTSAGVDQHFVERAIREQKSLGHLESPEQQLDFLANLGGGNEDLFVQYLLDTMPKLEQQFSRMKKAWLQADLDQLSETAEVDRLREEFPNVFDTILTQRNNDWMPKIEAMLQTPEVEFVLAGALHFVEQEGLLEQLEKKGITVSQLDGCG